MKNPKWHRDEIILALDLYFRTDPGAMHNRNPDVIELSEILNKLPVQPYRPDEEKFRNPNGVGLKLNNFKAIDPDYEGVGLERHSKLDEEIFNEFYHDRVNLRRIAQQIREVVGKSDLNTELHSIQTEEEEEVFVKEGGVVLKLHKYRERDSSIIRKKKQTALEREGKLSCEVCGFDFKTVYGEIGQGFIECHHKVPLSNINAKTVTKMDDLALVCANCHRMLHRKLDSFSVADLKSILN